MSGVLIRSGLTERSPAHALSVQRKDHEKRQQTEGGHLLARERQLRKPTLSAPGPWAPSLQSVGFSCLSSLPVVVCYDAPSKLRQDPKLETGAVGFGTKWSNGPRGQSIATYFLEGGPGEHLGVGSSGHLCL